MHLLDLRPTNHLLLLCKLQLVQSHFHHDLVTHDLYWISLNSNHLITLVLLQHCDKTIAIGRKAIPAKHISRVELIDDGIESKAVDQAIQVDIRSTHVDGDNSMFVYFIFEVLLDCFVLTSKREKERKEKKRTYIIFKIVVFFLHLSLYLEKMSIIWRNDTKFIALDILVTECKPISISSPFFFLFCNPECVI